MRKIAYSKDALKTLRRIPANISATIRAKIEQYANDPVSLANNVIQMQGRPGYRRMRDGDWRVIFSEDQIVIAIVRIAPRGGAYD
jgi:mRNA interferase RelE/StbE